MVERNHPKAEKAIWEHISSIRCYARNGVLVGLEADCDFEGNLIVPPGITNITLKLLEKDIDILAHPTRIFSWNGMEVPREEVDPLVDAAIANGVADANLFSPILQPKGGPHEEKSVGGAV